MKEKENKKSFKSEFGMMLALLKIGFIGFGGGSALIPVIEKEVVEERGLVTEEEFDKDVLWQVSHRGLFRWRYLQVSENGHMVWVA